VTRIVDDANQMSSTSDWGVSTPLMVSIGVNVIVVVQCAKGTTSESQGGRLAGHSWDRRCRRIGRSGARSKKTD